MKPTYFATPAAFRRWLSAHHRTAGELLVGFYKVGTGKPSITWKESVDQALCFGWIDGVRRSLGADAYTIRFTPRRARSIWSVVNTERFAQLQQEGQVAPAGRAAFAQREAKRSGLYSHEQGQAVKLTAEQRQALQADARAWADFQQRPPWYQRAATHWIQSAKQEATRARRLQALIDASAAGRTIAPLTRPDSVKR